MLKIVQKKKTFMLKCTQIVRLKVNRRLFSTLLSGNKLTICRDQSVNINI